MALDPILWALKDAPVADALERLALVVLAEHADEDGCGAYPSQGNVAKRCMSSRDAIKDRFDSLAARGLIRLGDQSRAAHIAPEYRPVVWDIAIPLVWWKNPERIQEYRASRGLPPLTDDERPDLPPPPAKKRRSDLGKKRPKQDDDEPLGDESTPGDTSPQGDTSGEGGGYKPGGVGDSSPPNHPGLPSPSPTQGLRGDAGKIVQMPVRDTAPSEGAEATLPGMPAPPHRPTANPKQPHPLIQQSTTLCSTWWNALPQKPVGAKTFRNVILIVADALQAGDWTEDQLMEALRACGPAVTVNALNIQLARLNQQSSHSGAGSGPDWDRVWDERAQQAGGAR